MNLFAKNSVVAGFISLIVSACTALPVAPPAPNITFTPDASGLSVAALDLRIDFGRAPEGVIAALDQNIGRHQVLNISGCPSGVVQQIRWGDLILTFTDEQFVGWHQNGTVQGTTCTSKN